MTIQFLNRSFSFLKCFDTELMRTVKSWSRWQIQEYIQEKHQLLQTVWKFLSSFKSYQYHTNPRKLPSVCLSVCLSVWWKIWVFISTVSFNVRPSSCSYVWVVQNFPGQTSTFCHCYTDVGSDLNENQWRKSFPGIARPGINGQFV